MAEQFQVTQQEKPFAPLQATDFVSEFDRHIRERDAMNAPYEASIRARGRQGIEDANKQVREMEQLAKLSKSLTNKLTKIQEQANEEQYAQGLADALMEDPDFFGQQELEAQEQQLIDGQAVATQTSKRYLAEGGSERNAREIRNTGGWYGYGRFVGQLQLMGDNYGMALEEAKSSFSININGREVTYDQLQSRDEYNAWTRGFNSQYMRGIPRTNGDVVEKYVLRSARQALNNDRLKWSRKFEENRKAEEKEARTLEFMDSINRGDTNVVQRAFATFPGSNREIRDEIEANLLDAVDVGYMTSSEAINFYETQTVVKDGKVQTMAEAFPLQYRQFVDKAENARAQEAKEYQTVRATEAAELQQILDSSEQLSDAQIAELKTSDKYRNNSAAKQVLDNYLTSEEIEDEQGRSQLEALYRTGQLTPAHLKHYNKALQDEFGPKAEESSLIEGEYDADTGDSVADGAAQAVMGYTRGEVPNKDDLDYQTYHSNASNIHRQAYAEARRSGKDHIDAMDYARQQVEFAVEKDQDRITTKPAKVTLDNTIDKANAAIKADPTIISTKEIPGTPSGALSDSLEYLRTGRGSMSGFYQALAQTTGISADKIVLAQAKAAGMDDVVKKIEESPAWKSREALPPSLQRLIDVRPNVHTFTQSAVRAQLGGSDTKYFLDTVASKESESYGGYDAYNLGGSAGGHVAHGSGNSAKDGRFGKPVSQLTIGEIKRLHASGQAHAMGRYQFIGSTFAEVAPLTGLPDSTVFGPKVQDLFAITRLIQRASWGSLQSGLKSEWIGLQYLNGPQYQKLVEAARGAIQEARK